MSDNKKIYGIAGENARFVGLFTVFLPIFIAIFLAGYIIGIATPIDNPSTTVIGTLMLCMAFAFGIAIIISRRKLALYYKGAKGEENVASELAKLSNDFVVFNDFSPGGSGFFKSQRTIDHIVVGPPGVFVIETKNWNAEISIDKGQILYDGKKPDNPPLAQARESTKQTKEWIEKRIGASNITYHSVVCFASNQLKDTNIYVSGVQVCNMNALTDFIENALVIPMEKEVTESVIKCFAEFFEGN